MREYIGESGNSGARGRRFHTGHPTACKALPCGNLFLSRSAQAQRSAGQIYPHPSSGAFFVSVPPEERPSGKTERPDRNRHSGRGMIQRIFFHWTGNISNIPCIFPVNMLIFQLICKSDDRVALYYGHFLQRKRDGGSRLGAVPGFPPGAAI